MDWASIGGIFEFESSSTRDNRNHHNCLLDWLCGFQHIMRSYGGVRPTRDVPHATNSVGGGQYGLRARHQIIGFPAIACNGSLQQLRYVLRG